MDRVDGQGLTDIMKHLRWLTLLLVAVCLLVFAWLQSRPQVFPDAPHGQFACLSYTPQGDDSLSPTSPEFTQLVRAQIERDLAQLSQRTRCVRTYSVSNEIDYVPEVARRLNMRVMLGLWIGRNVDTNEKEIAHGIDVANAHRDVIDAVIVGNEVLLRHEQSADAMQGLLARVREATRLPVTYADVWEFWLRNPELADNVDFITIHILPYWEDFPIDINRALDHVRNIYGKVTGQFAGKKIFIGEVGWPSAGRQREGAIPSLMNQARFTREFIAYAETNQIPYNFIEAYDQPWKRGLEGTVGGNWGVYTAEGKPKFALTGPLVADPQWWRSWVAAAVGCVLLGLWSIKRRLALTMTVGNAFMGVALGALLVMQWDYLWVSCRNLREWLAMSVFVSNGVLLVLCELYSGSERMLRVRNVLWLLFLIMLAYINLGLVFEGRYRDFPSIFVLLPILLLLFTPAQAPASWRSVVWLLASWLTLSGLLLPLIEKPGNQRALIWSALCLLVGGWWLWRSVRSDNGSGTGAGTGTGNGIVERHTAPVSQAIGEQHRTQ